MENVGGFARNCTINDGVLGKIVSNYKTRRPSYYVEDVFSATGSGKNLKEFQGSGVMEPEDMGSFKSSYKSVCGVYTQKSVENNEHCNGILVRCKEHKEPVIMTSAEFLEKYFKEGENLHFVFGDNMRYSIRKGGSVSLEFNSEAYIYKPNECKGNVAIVKCPEKCLSEESYNLDQLSGVEEVDFNGAILVSNYLTSAFQKNNHYSREDLESSSLERPNIQALLIDVGIGSRFARMCLQTTAFIVHHNLKPTKAEFDITETRIVSSKGSLFGSLFDRKGRLIGFSVGHYKNYVTQNEYKTVGMSPALSINYVIKCLREGTTEPPKQKISEMYELNEDFVYNVVTSK